MGRSEVNLAVRLRNGLQISGVKKMGRRRAPPGSQLRGFYSNARPVPTPTK
jgi:hypothetical protein